MAVNLEVNVDPSKAEAGFQKVGDAAQEAGNVAESAGKEAEKATQGQLDKLVELRQEMRDLTVSEKEAREAATAAAQAAEEEAQAQARAAAETAKKQKAETDAARAREKAERDAEQAAQAAATARQVEMLRAGEAAKSIAEGVGQFAEVYARTGDLNEALGATGEKMTAAMATINPMAGVLTAAALAGVKLWQNFNGAKEAAEKAAEATKRWKEEAAAANKFMAGGIAEAARLASTFSDVFSVGDQIGNVQKELDRIAATRQIIADQVSKVPEAVAMELLEQKSLLKVEESKLLAQKAILENRHLQLAAEKTLASHNRDALKEAEKQIKKIREEAKASVVEQMSKENERAKAATKNVEEKAKLDKKLEEDLQKLNEETAKKLRENYKLYNKDNDERKKLLDQLREGESKLNDVKEENHRKDLERIEERVRKEIEARQRQIEAEAEMQRGIHKVQEDAEKAKRAKQEADPGVQDLAKRMQVGANDERKVFEGFVRERVKAAEAARKAAMDQAQAQAEAHARENGFSEEAAKRAGRTDRARVARETQGDVARARKQAADDWKDFQSGKDIAGSDPNDGKVDEGEARHDQTGKDIGRARNEIITRNVQEANKALERQHGLTQAQIAAAKEGLAIAERIAREVAAMSAEMNAFKQWQASVMAGVKATEEGGRRRRGQANGA